MTINFMAENAVEFLHRNLQHYLRDFAASTNEEILRHLEESLHEKPLLASNYTLPDNLQLDSNTRGSDEKDNVIKIHSHLQDLPHSIACDARFWTGLTIGSFWNYTKERWLDKEDNLGLVRDHFLFVGQSKKVYTRNAIARLWWLGDLTHDEDRDDPYEVTGFILQDTDYIVNLLERNFSSNKKITREFVDAVEKARTEGWVIARKEIRDLCKYLNLLGGAYVLDAFPDGLIFEKIYTKSIVIGRKRA